jgi:hypothetical protein
MTIASLEQYSERQTRSLHRILERMSASEQRAETLYKRRRQHDRRQFQGVVLIYVPTPEAPEPSEDHPATFRAWAYNVSQGGVGFVSPEPIPGEQLMVGLKLPNDKVRWMNGRLVRNRPIPDEDFIDYGVSFVRPDA